MTILHIGARAVLIPSTNTVNWLVAQINAALNVAVGVWASIAIVNSPLLYLVRTALLIFVHLIIVNANPIVAPLPNTINWLVASLCDTLNLFCLVWALLAIQVSLGGDLVGPAALVLVTCRDVIAAAIHSPLALTINRLTATALGAMLQVVLVWTRITVVLGLLAHSIEAATLVLVISIVIGASRVLIPSTNTVNRLGTSIVCALLKLVGIWASISVVGGLDRDLVQSAALVLMNLLVMEASIILVPSSDTVDRLDAKLGAALNIGVSIWTGIAIV